VPGSTSSDPSKTSSLAKRRAAGGSQRRSSAGITPAQAIAAGLAAAGRTKTEIAAEMEISLRSVSRHLQAARAAGIPTTPAPAAGPAKPKPRQSARTGRIEKPRKPQGYARVFCTDPEHGLVRMKGIGAALDPEYNPEFSLGDYGDPDGSGRRMQLIGRSVADLGDRSALDHYSEREVAERAARARGATRAIEIAPDGSYIVTEL
jgi:DNA-binding CsgD family transcriptional regulator